MPSKKKTQSKDKPVNMDFLTKKMNQIGKELDELQLDVKDIAVDLLKLLDEDSAKKSLLDRIKNRLGL